MDRRDFLKASTAMAVCSTMALPKSLLAAVTVDDTHLWDRPVHITYVGSNNKSFGNEYSDQDIIDLLRLVKTSQGSKGGVTAVTPFFLNSSNASSFSNIIDLLKRENIGIVPGIGRDPDDGPYQDYFDIADDYRNFTTFIRLENTQGFYNAHGKASIQNAINQLVTKGFTHIMLNPWPQEDMGRGAAVDFVGAVLKSSFTNINKNTWTLNTGSYSAILDYKQSVKIVAEYESEPAHLKLADMERANPGSSITKMKLGADQCQDNASNLYWAPPWTKVYDAPSQELHNTWKWIAQRLSQMP